MPTYSAKRAGKVSRSSPQPSSPGTGCLPAVAGVSRAGCGVRRDELCNRRGVESRCAEGRNVKRLGRDPVPCPVFNSLLVYFEAEVGQSVWKGAGLYLGSVPSKQSFRAGDESV